MNVAEEFVAIDPTPLDYLRGIVLFGRNVASYKFALATSLLELAREGRTDIPMTELAVPFSAHLCAHLVEAPKQATSASSRFLDACRRFNANEITQDQLVAETAQLGFANVIDAFHVVGGADIPVRFFDDARRSNVPSIVLTDDVMSVSEGSGADALEEVDARWRLVETAWDLGVSRSLIAYDDRSGLLVASDRRRSVTSARSALNGYQKGRCFYCFRPIDITTGTAVLADVDHLFPHVLERLALTTNLDGLWNLVLSCVECNRGQNGKFDLTPDVGYVARLHRRNEYLIGSHHPLRDVLMTQTGTTRKDRRTFLQRMLDLSRSYQPAAWSTPALASPRF